MNTELFKLIAGDVAKELDENDKALQLLESDPGNPNVSVQASKLSKFMLRRALLEDRKAIIKILRDKLGEELT